MKDLTAKTQRRLRGRVGGLRRVLGRTAVLAAVLVSFGGCSMIYKTTGDVMNHYSTDHAVPYVMSTDDLDINCSMSQALSPLLLSFGRVTSEPDKLAVMMYLSTGACAEQRAWEEELRAIRALRDQKPDEAQDAIYTQQRFQVLAAERQYKAYKHLVNEFGEPGGEECPDLDDEFDQFVWMMGLVAGLQALNNEIQSNVAIGVPKNIAGLASEGAACLDDDELWGVPMAIRATVWSMLPSSMPMGENAWERLETAAFKGERAGIRLPHVMMALAAQGEGDEEKVKEIIRRHAKSKKKRDPNPERRLIDEMATLNMLAISDRLWTENTGHRTPTGGLGTFWDDKKAKKEVDTSDFDDLL